MGLNEDLGDRENVGNASLARQKFIERAVALSYDRVLERALDLACYYLSETCGCYYGNCTREELFAEARHEILESLK